MQYVISVTEYSAETKWTVNIINVHNIVHVAAHVEVWTFCMSSELCSYILVLLAESS